MNQRHLDFRLDKPIVYTAGDFYHLNPLGTLRTAAIRSVPIMKPSIVCACPI